MKVTFRTHSISPGDHGNAIAPKQFLSRSLRRRERSTLLEVGSDRVLFSVDYPYETMQEQSDWFESVPISEGDGLKIGRANAQQLLRMAAVVCNSFCMIVPHIGSADPPVRLIGIKKA
jgi:hypothetical protein